MQRPGVVLSCSEGVPFSRSDWRVAKTVDPRLPGKFLILVEHCFVASPCFGNANGRKGATVMGIVNGHGTPVLLWERMTESRPGNSASLPAS